MNSSDRNILYSEGIVGGLFLSFMFYIYYRVCEIKRTDPDPDPDPIPPPYEEV